MSNAWPTLTLEIKSPDGTSQRRVVQAERSIIGRESGDIVLNDPEASALHAEIDCSGGHVIVRDLGSRNGTLRDGKHMPQFALHLGQSFMVGATEIRLVAIEGGSVLVATGDTRITSLEDLDLLTTTAKATKRRAEPEASKPTAVKGSVRGRPPLPPSRDAVPSVVAPQHTTVLGGAPPPAQGPASGERRGEELEEFDVTRQFDASMLARPGNTSIAPSPRPGALAGKVGPAPVAASPAAATVAGPLSSVVVPAPAPLAPPVVAMAPVPVPIPPPAPLPPTAAVAAPLLAPPPAGPVGAPFPGQAGDPFRPMPGRGPLPRPAPRRRSAGPVLVFLVVLLAAVGFGVYTYGLPMLEAQKVAYGRAVASDLPLGTIAMVAVSAPTDLAVAFGAQPPESLRGQAIGAFGFDPFAVGDPKAAPSSSSGWSGAGIDAAAPFGFGLLGLDGAVAVSIGLSDRGAFTNWLDGRAQTWFRDPGLRFSARAFAGEAGLWIDRPFAGAVVFKGNRAVLIAGAGTSDPNVIIRRAEAIAAPRQGMTLADQPGFEGIAPPEASSVALVYVDGPAARSAAELPMFGLDRLFLQSLADVDGYVAVLSHAGSALHLTQELVVREGSRQLELLSGPPRTTRALGRISAPVVAEFDAQVDADALQRWLGSLISISFGAGNFAAVEKQFEAGVGVSLREIISNLGGAGGIAFTALPTLDARSLSAVAWVSVQDDQRARMLAARVYEKLQSTVKIQTRVVEGVTVYDVDAGFTGSVFVHDGFVWIAFGRADVATMIRGPGQPFRSVARHPSIAFATSDGGQIAGFIDVQQAAGGLSSYAAASGWQTWLPMLSRLDVLTVQGKAHGRAISITTSLVTTFDNALAGLVVESGRIVSSPGPAFDTKKRAEQCVVLGEHVLTLTRQALEGTSVDDTSMSALEAKVLAACNRPDMSDDRLACYLAAGTVEALETCDKDGGGVGVIPT